MGGFLDSEFVNQSQIQEYALCGPTAYVWNDSCLGDFFTGSQHKSNDPAAPSAPTFNFMAQTVVAVVATAPRTGSLQIDSAWICEGTLSLWATLTEPGLNCGVPAWVTEPYHIIALDRLMTQAVIPDYLVEIVDCPP